MPLKLGHGAKYRSHRTICHPDLITMIAHSITLHINHLLSVKRHRLLTTNGIATRANADADQPRQSPLLASTPVFHEQMQCRDGRMAVLFSFSSDGSRLLGSTSPQTFTDVSLRKPSHMPWW
jgi:hypothetical protein